MRKTLRFSVVRLAKGMNCACIPEVRMSILVSDICQSCANLDHVLINAFVSYFLNLDSSPFSIFHKFTSEMCGGAVALLTSCSVKRSVT